MAGWLAESCLVVQPSYSVWMAFMGETTSKSFRLPWRHSPPSPSSSSTALALCAIRYSLFPTVLSVLPYPDPSILINPIPPFLTTPSSMWHATHHRESPRINPSGQAQVIQA